MNIQNSMEVIRKSVEQAVEIPESETYAFPGPHDETCDGTGWLILPGNRRDPSDKGKCQCLKRQDVRNRMGRYLRSVDYVSPAHAGQLKTLSDDKGSVPMVYSVFNAYRKQHTGCNSILLCGEAGSGKTASAHCLMRHVLKNGHPAAFVSCSEYADAFARQVHSMGCAEHVETVAGWVKDSQLYLVLDDLGAERGGVKACERIAEIIHLRSDQMAPTVITTNLSGGDIKARYGQRVASRLLANPSWMCSISLSSINLRTNSDKL